MPVRRIPKNYLFVTGGLQTSKSADFLDFESLSEKDYLLLLDADDDVLSVEVQPVRVPVPGIARGYVPDVLVHFKDAQRQPELIEVKAASDLERNAEKYAPKFAAAAAFCEARGWVFIIKKKDDFPAQRLKNLKFLRAYRRALPHDGGLERLIAWLAAEGGKSTFEACVNAHCANDDAKAHWLPTLWGAIAHAAMHVNLDEPMWGESEIWLSRAQK